LNHSVTAHILILQVCLLSFLLIGGAHAWAEDFNLNVSGHSLLAAAETSPETSAKTGDSTWEDEENWEEGWDEAETIADPLEPLNRLFFRFNDKLYYWVLKPVARVYSGIMPQELRISVGNFFDNLLSPGRAVNSLLQGEVKDFSVEVTRFVLNSTAGILGLGDFARDVLDLRSSEEDTGQTLGYYGLGGVFYIVWPFLGPSNFRDSLGKIGDGYLNPVIFLDAESEVTFSLWTLDRVNYTSLTLGDYELFTETALDPYVAVKDAYQQYREGQIKK
jgi:phospholipid-binding lipoprotein MlaA